MSFTCDFYLVGDTQVRESKRRRNETKREFKECMPQHAHHHTKNSKRCAVA